jgi:hypothetical protein
MLLGDVLRTATDQAPDQRALVFGAAALTYRELGQQSERIAGSLRRAGVGHGDRVVLFFGNRPELILGYFACFRLGAYKGAGADRDPRGASARSGRQGRPSRAAGAGLGREGTLKRCR